MTTFDRNTVKVIRDDIAIALQAVEKKYNIKMSLGAIRFDNNQFGGKLTAVTANSTSATVEGNVKWQAAFLRYAPFYGLQASDLGKSFNLRGEEVTLVGARPNAKNPLVLKKSNGNFIAVDIAVVKNSLGK